MKDIIEENYKSIVSRGLITPNTTISDFIDKLYEEVKEVEDECKFCPEIHDYRTIDLIDKDKLGFELADVRMVVENFARHYDIDIEYYLKEKIKINFDRAKNNK